MKKVLETADTLDQSRSARISGRGFSRDAQCSWFAKSTCQQVHMYLSVSPVSIASSNCVLEYFEYGRT